jgi:hypothetical protein
VTEREHAPRDGREDDLAEVAEIEDAELDADPTAITAIEDGVPFTPPDAPTASQSYGTTAGEQRAGESFDRRLAEEEPDVDVPHTDDHEDDRLDAEEAALHIVDGPDRLPGATDDPIDHYVEDADAAEDVGRRAEDG